MFYHKLCIFGAKSRVWISTWEEHVGHCCGCSLYIFLVRILDFLRNSEIIMMLSIKLDVYIPGGLEVWDFVRIGVFYFQNKGDLGCKWKRLLTSLCLFWPVYSQTGQNEKSLRVCFFTLSWEVWEPLLRTVKELHTHTLSPWWRPRTLSPWWRPRTLSPWWRPSPLCPRWGTPPSTSRRPTSSSRSRPTEAPGARRPRGWAASSEPRKVAASAASQDTGPVAAPNLEE